MADELYRERRIIPETNTGFTAFSGPFFTPETLAGIVGTVPSQFNMMPWGSFWTSTNFTDSRFQPNNASVSQPVAPSAPDGTATTQKLVENNNNSEHSINTGVNGLNMWSAGTGIPFTIGFIARPAERVRIYATWSHLIAGNPDANGFASIGFDLSGIQTYGASATGFTNVSSSITALRDGWVLCKMTVTNDLAYNGVLQAYWVQLNLDNGSGASAPSISYTGNGSSGAYVWWLGMLPTCSWVAPWNQAFHDDFTTLDTIDINNTKVPGFKWFTNGYWPNSFVIAPWVTQPNIHCPANALSISSPSVLEINNPANNQSGFSSMIMTACPAGASSDSYFGFAPQPPMIWDVYMSYDSLAADYSPNWTFAWPSVWSPGVEALTSNVNIHWLEHDVFEAHNNLVLDTENTTTDHDNPISGAPGNPYSASYFKVFNPGVFHRVSNMWLTVAQTGGSYGIIMSFYDGTFLGGSDLAYSASAIPQHPINGGAPGPVGDIFIGESQHYPVLIDTGENETANPGGGWPLFIDYVKVYTA